MARPLPTHEFFDSLRFLRGKPAFDRQFRAADATLSVAPRVDDRLAMGTSFLLGPRAHAQSDEETLMHLGHFERQPGLKFHPANL